MDWVLTTDALCKRYGHCKALDGLTMHVPKGAIYGFIGKNGAGKTTLIRLICGLQRPTAGGYALYGVGHGEKSIAKARRRMGAVVETPSIYLDLSAQENLREQYRVIFSTGPAMNAPRKRTDPARCCPWRWRREKNWPFSMEKKRQPPAAPKSGRLYVCSQ